MKKTKPGACCFFVDESGDPTFYDRKGNLIVGHPGCSPILILGYIKLGDPQPIRKAILDLQENLVHDAYFRDFPSVQSSTAVAFHAKNDLPEIRYQFFKLISTLDFKTHFIVARKIERVFRNNFHARENEFYDHLVEIIFEGQLHRHENNLIYFAKRGSRNRQAPLETAIRISEQRFAQKWGTRVATQYSVQAQTPLGEPCLSIIDYMNWAVFQAFTRQEMRYYSTVEEKVSLLIDLYDQQKYPKNWYNRKNPFDINKITPL
jgi:hypothetical protein